MKRLVPITAAVAVIAALVATSALAKGASEALITGPGLDAGIALRSDGGDGSAQLGELANSAGFYPSVFATSPNPMQTRRPAGDLGPRYTITYTMPGPNGDNELRQDVYPYAKPGPVTHTQAGQRYFGSQRTVGGWYVATTTLKDQLVAAGLSSSPPGSDALTLRSWPVVGLGLAVLVALLAATLLVAARRPPAQRHVTP